MKDPLSSSHSKLTVCVIRWRLKQAFRLELAAASEGRGEPKELKIHTIEVRFRCGCCNVNIV
jgi:hypothetical protein